jgi:hypothetical protein
MYVGSLKVLLLQVHHTLVQSIKSLYSLNHYAGAAQLLIFLCKVFISMTFRTLGSFGGLASGTQGRVFEPG